MLCFDRSIGRAASAPAWFAAAAFSSNSIRVAAGLVGIHLF